MKLPFDTSTPVTGEASTVIDTGQDEVFRFIADEFFENYPKWAPDVIELKFLDGEKVQVGAKGRQVRQDVDSVIESVFEITEYHPYTLFVFQGASPHYRTTYITEKQAESGQTKLTFRFDLLEVDLFMRPFVKLIKVAIEDGAETTVEKIKELLTSKPA